MKGAYEGLLSSLDAESEYLTAAEYEAIKRGDAGGEADAGIALTRRDGVLFIASVLPGTDAQAKGLRLGDQIRRIGDRAGRDLNLSEAMRVLKGPSGSSVILAVSRREDPRREDVTVIRKKLALPAPRLDPAQDTVAVVRLPAFGPGAARGLNGILDRLQKEKVRRAVFDLRGNAWGQIDEAVRAASLLVGDKVIAKVRDRKGEERSVNGSGSKHAWSGEMLLLTDPGTAYAAEVFVSALTDAGVAKQAGETTLGRGGEQEILPLANGDYLSLTVRKLTSAAGKGWHGSGLTPSVPLPADPADPFKDRAEHQLKKAIDWLREPAHGEKAA
jgi:carboxyl-terminal processing protease